MSDHKPRVQRWMELLTTYSYTLHHRKGSTNGNTDMLSLFPPPATGVDRTGDSHISMHVDIGVYLILPHMVLVWVGYRLWARDKPCKVIHLHLATSRIDFRMHGLRMSINYLHAPSGRIRSS